MNNKQRLSYSHQSGFALFMVLVMMVVIAFLVIATLLSTTTNSRTSANDSDRQLAMQNAQLGLTDAENKILEWGEDENTSLTFSCDCKAGLCAAKDLKATDMGSKNLILQSCSTANLLSVWKRPEVFTDSAKDPSISSSEVDSASGTKRRYVIEYMGKNSDKKFLFRITAKGWGKNSASSAMVQEVIEATMPIFNQ